MAKKGKKRELCTCYPGPKLVGVLPYCAKCKKPTT